MTFDIKSYLSKWVPGTLHEAIPHGVPIGYNWRERATRCKWCGSDSKQDCPNGCPNGTNYILNNWWMGLYVDESNQYANNVRVNVWKDVKLLFLYQGSSTWQLVQRSLNNTSTWQGAAYPEDFIGTNIAIDKRLETDGTISYLPRIYNGNGYNAHFYPGSYYQSEPNKIIHAIVIGHVRLIKTNPSGPDNRASSKFIIQAGADLRYSGQTGIIRGFGAGVFIKPTSEWRTLVMSTLSLDNLNTLPLPPKEYFVMPDGNYPDTCSNPVLRMTI